MAELRRAGIDTMAAANKYIDEIFLPDMNRRFARQPLEEGTAFVSAQGADLDRIFAIRHEGRTVANDNTVRVNNLVLQLEKSPFREHFAKCQVDVFEHLDGTYTVAWKTRAIGRFDEQGNPMGINAGGQPPDPRGLSHPGPGKGQKEKGQRIIPLTPFPAVSWALGSLPSVALSSRETSEG